MEDRQEILNNKELVDAKLAVAQGANCDKYDYLISVFCGVSCGLIDAFLVGKPNFEDAKNSKLGTLTDTAANKFTESIADKLIAKDLKELNELRKKYKGEELARELEKRGIPSNFPRRKNPPYPDLKDKITYLENKYRVSYDQSTNDKTIGDAVNITPNNHHMKSLAHCPDIIGLSFAILDQFTDTTSFVQGGKVIRVVPVNNKVELRGSDFLSKLFCAFCNWMGHLLSDFCGSHSSKGRGDGIPIPFFEVFQFCDFGNFTSADGEYTIATLAMKVYENGYDARFGMALAIPVILNDLMVRFIWALKKHFYSKKSWKECIPSNKHSDLRIMLLISNASLCLTDGADALIRGHGDILEICLHLNVIAWFKLVKRALLELELRFGFTYEDLLVEYQFIHLQLEEYNNKLRSINYEQYAVQLDNAEAYLSLFDPALIKEKKVSNELWGYIKTINSSNDISTDDDFDEIVLNSKTLHL